MTQALENYAIVDAGQGAPQGEDNYNFRKDGYPFIRAGSLDSLVNGGSIDECEYINDDIAGSHRLKLYPKNSIVFAKSGMSAKLGRVYRLEKDAYVVNHLAILKPKDNLVPRYLEHFLRYNNPKTLIKDDSYPSIGLADIKAWNVNIPASKDEQKRIATLLDQADELCRARRRSIARLSDFSQAIFYEMFGDWTQSKYKGKLIKLGEVLDFLTSGSRGWAAYYREHGSLFLRIQNVKSDSLDLSDVAYVEAPHTAEANRTRVRPGDVLLSITADLGRTAVIPEDIGDAYINQHLSILRTNYFNPRYLSAALASYAGQKTIGARNRGGVKAGLNFDDIRSFEIPDVDRSQQDIFAKRVIVADKQIQGLEFSLLSFEKLFLSIQNSVFKGRL